MNESDRLRIEARICNHLKGQMQRSLDPLLLVEKVASSEAEVIDVREALLSMLIEGKAILTSDRKVELCEYELPSQLDLLAKLVAELCFTYKAMPRDVANRVERYLDDLYDIP